MRVIIAMRLQRGTGLLWQTWEHGIRYLGKEGVIARQGFGQGIGIVLGLRREGESSIRRG